MAPDTLEATTIPKVSSQDWKEQERLEDDLQAALQGLPKLSPTRAQLHRVSRAYQALGDWSEALHIEQKIIESYNSSMYERALGLYQQGQLSVRLENLRNGWNFYQQAWDCINADDNHDHHDYSVDKARILMGMAGVQFRQDKPEAALSALQKSQTLLEKSIALENEADSTVTEALRDCWQHQGFVHRNSQNFAAALHCYQQAIGITDDAPVGLLLDIADMHAALEQTLQAIACYQELLDAEVATASPDQALRGHLLYSLGKLYAQQKHTNEAIRALRHALQHQESVDEWNPAVGKTLTTLGAVYASCGQSTEALPCFQRALLIARRHADNDTSDQQDPSVLLALRNLDLLRRRPN